MKEPNLTLLFLSARDTTAPEKVLPFPAPPFENDVNVAKGRCPFSP